MNRTKLLLLFGLFLLPIAASYLAYYVWQPEGRKNYGELVQQVEVQVAGVDLAGAAASMQPHKGKWVMLYVGASQCDAQCEQLLYFMRQTRKAQGREMDRIERVWLLTDSGMPSDTLRDAHAGMHYLRIAGQELPKTVTKALSLNHLHMVDPMGHLMMRWPQQADPKRIIQDIKHLLKASQIG